LAKYHSQIPAARSSLTAAVLYLAKLRSVPRISRTHRFLAFWQEKLEGPLHSVCVAHCKLIKPAELKAVDGEFRLH
jgi:uncharacterized protein Usg